ncbi:MAG: zinc-binding dehydrogenase [Gemmatimonadales bacterium]|nr:zinc-binding dehydrogenase [Gemmatimonadota bacterium]MCL4213879.1 zinc-binding dehydrogenase [Gemmatimonadales bacterium]
MQLRALTIDAHGGLEQLRYREDVATPELTGSGSVRVRLHTAALNRLDLFTLGGLPGVTITPPWVMGADGMGVIEAMDADVRGLALGDRVVINPGISCRGCEFCARGEHSLCTRFRLLGEHLPGSFAEFVVVPATNVRRIPASVPDDVAAAFTLATLTAWRMCVTRAQVKAGDDVLIWGIGGGVAIAALQICVARGARVWVTSSSAAKRVRALALGAHEALDHTAGDVDRQVRRLTGRRGVDVVVESVGEKTWAQSLGSLARGGRLVTCGGTSGPAISMDVRRLFWHQWSIHGSTMGNDAEFDAVVAELAAGRLIPPVDSVHALRDGRAAFARLEEGAQFGKVVLRIGDD